MICAQSAIEISSKKLWKFFCIFSEFFILLQIEGIDNLFLNSQLWMNVDKKSTPSFFEVKIIVMY